MYIGTDSGKRICFIFMYCYCDYDFFFQSVQVICNYSHRPRRGHAVYELDPPSEVGYTVKCGCPPGTDEDADCLCYKSPRNAIEGIQHQPINLPTAGAQAFFME
jgi:hypothetical protein